MFEGFPNAQIYIVPANEIGVEGINPASQEAIFQNKYALAYDVNLVDNPLGLFISAGSGNKMLTLEEDNFGFARWVSDNAKELFKLGPGRHYYENLFFEE